LRSERRLPADATWRRLGQASASYGWQASQLD